MDDDRKKFPRKGASKPGGARTGGDAPRKGGKPGFAGKPRFEGGKPFKRDGDRPFGKRPEAAAGGGEARPERQDAQFRKGPRPERKPFEKREGERVSRPGRFERDGAKGEGHGQRQDRGEEKRGRSFDKPGHKGGERHAGRDDFKRGDARSKSFSSRPVAEEPSGERIAKRLARVGIASRRDAEELIAAGRIRVNGKVLESPAFNVMPEDRIELDDTLIPPVERTRLFLFHKPAGVVTTNRDPEGRKTVFELLPTELPRLMTVGRLDINTEGLLLFTNDGGLSRVLELPSTGWMRRYRVRVHGKVDEARLAELKDGIAVDGVFYGAVEASLDREQGSNAWQPIG
jgi:23S rRNA pseudouridine2605 synthase